MMSSWANENQRGFDNPYGYSPGASGGFGRFPQGFGFSLFGDGGGELGGESSGGSGPVYDGTLGTVVVSGEDPSQGYPTSDSSGGDGSGSPPWWAVLGPSLLKVVSNVFAPVQTSVAQAQAGAYRTPVYSATGQVINPYGTTPTGIGIGLDANGIRLSDGSHISWLLILSAVGIFALVQAKGFQRR